MMRNCLSVEQLKVESNKLRPGHWDAHQSPVVHASFLGHDPDMANITTMEM
jgi:hypothetical protein